MKLHIGGKGNSVYRIGGSCVPAITHAFVQLQEQVPSLEPDVAVRLSLEVRNGADQQQGNYGGGGGRSRHSLCAASARSWWFVVAHSLGVGGLVHHGADGGLGRAELLGAGNLLTAVLLSAGGGSGVCEYTISEYAAPSVW